MSIFRVSKAFAGIPPAPRGWCFLFFSGCRYSKGVRHASSWGLIERLRNPVETRNERKSVGFLGMAFLHALDLGGIHLDRVVSAQPEEFDTSLCERTFSGLSGIVGSVFPAYIGRAWDNYRWSLGRGGCNQHCSQGDTSASLPEFVLNIAVHHRGKVAGVSGETKDQTVVSTALVRDDAAFHSVVP